MDHLVEKYLSQYSEVRSGKTVEFKRCALSWLEGLRDMTRGEVFELYGRMRQRVRHSTALAYLEEIRRFYEFLRREGYGLEFDLRALREVRSKREHERHRKYFTEEEVRRIFDCLRGIDCGAKHPVYYLLCVVLLSSGLRLSEALSLKKESFFTRQVVGKDGQKKELLLVRVQGKFAKSREVPFYFFFDGHRQLILRRLSELKQDQPFFIYQLVYPNQKKKELVLSRASALKLFQEIEKSLGFPINAHRFRYTYATWLATKGVPMPLLQDILGHSSPRTTLGIYAQAQKERLLEVFSEL